MKLEFGTESEIRMNEKAEYSDGLSILLTSFSHKRPYTNGPTKATAYLTLAKGWKKGELMLSIHGVQGVSRDADGLSDSERYECKQWKKYEFKLTGFDYDQSIKVIVTKG